MRHGIHPIEERSYAILRSRADTWALPPWTRAVVERVIHASADPVYLSDLVCAALLRYAIPANGQRMITRMLCGH